MHQVKPNQWEGRYSHYTHRYGGKPGRLHHVPAYHSVAWNGNALMTVKTSSWMPLYKQQEEVLVKAFEALQFTVFQNLSFDEVMEMVVDGSIDIEPAE